MSFKRDVERVVDRGKETVEDAATGVKRAVEHGAKDAKDAAEDAKGAVEDERERERLR